MPSLQMNDAAGRLLGLHERLPSACLPGGIAPGLEDMLERGVVRRGQVLTWAGSAGDAEGEPSYFRDRAGMLREFLSP